MTAPRTRKIFLIVTVLSVTAALLYIVVTGRDNVETKAFRVEGGWGYSVSIDGKKVIHQPFIPAADGNRPFKTRRDALRTGRIVKKKILQDVEPTVTIEELHKAGISTS